MGIFYKISLYGLGKRLYAGFLVVGYKTVSKPDPPQLFKQFPCPFICRCAVRDNGIINIKKKPSVSFSVKLLIVNYIRRIQIFIRKKLLNIYSTSVFFFQVIIKFTQTVFHYFIPMLVNPLNASAFCSVRETVSISGRITKI